MHAEGTAIAESVENSKDELDGADITTTTGHPSRISFLLSDHSIYVQVRVVFSDSGLESATLPPVVQLSLLLHHFNYYVAVFAYGWHGQIYWDYWDHDWQTCCFFCLDCLLLYGDDVGLEQFLITAG